MDEPSRHFETLAVGRGEAPEADAGDIVSPVHLATTFALPGVDPEMDLESPDPAAGEYLYTRLANPTRRALEQRLAALAGGEHAMAFASGTSAVASAIVACVEAGDHVVAFEDLYGGTRTLLDGLVAERMGVEVEYVDATDVERVAEAVRPETELLWMETPTNPLLKLCDIAAIADVAADCGATLGVDNTFASPYFQRPLELGADVVALSTTKFVNGHSDSLGGAVVTDDPDLAEAVGFLQRAGLGNVLAPFDAYMVLRGSKTLALRMDRHESNATAVAECLAAHDAVEAVNYPGLESHPQHDLAARQMSGYGGVLSAELRGGVAAAEAFWGALEEFAFAVSLGGVESLVEHPATMTHSTLSADERAELGIGDGLVRLSVGIEHEADLVADVERGLEAVAERVGVDAD